MAAALDFLERYERDGEEMLSSIVTGDETWVHHITPSTKKKSMVWKEPSSKKFKTVLSTNKVVCMFFWNAKRVIRLEYLLEGTTISAERYCEMLKNLRKVIKRKGPGLLTKGVILMHNNARSHSVNVTQELLQLFRWDVFRHPIPQTSLHRILHFFQPSRSHSGW